MGVIQRQGLKSSIINYIGVGLGILSTLFIYPKALEIIGLFRSLYDASVLIGIFVLLGSSISAIRFFPKYQDGTSGHQGLLTWSLLVVGLGFLLFLMVFPFVKPYISDFFFHERNSMFHDMVGYVIPLTLLFALINLFSRYTSNFRRIAIPAAIEQLPIKITVPLIILAYLQGWLTVDGVMISVVASFTLAVIGLILYLRYLGEWRLAKPVILKDKVGLKEYSKYSWYGLLSGIGSQISFKIDSLMVAGMIQFQAAGVYAIAWALTEIIIKPMRSLSYIAGPLIAQHIANDNMNEVRNIYRKSTLNMTIIGAGLFLLIWSVLPYIFRIMPKTEVMQQGTYVVFFLGLAQVWDMMTGINSEIISYSKHYKFTLYLTLLLGIITVGANLLFIPLYGMTGAAIATCLSLFLFNAAKLIFIRIKFGFHPFTFRIIPAIGFCVAAWLITRALPEHSSGVFNLFYKSAVFCLIYGLAIWRFNISPDINHWINLFSRKMKSLVMRA
jgi:O-antigen/teichoic acid export membrane protein